MNQSATQIAIRESSCESTHSEPGSEAAGEWHNEQARDRSNFIAELMIDNPRNNEIIIAEIAAKITIADCQVNSGRQSWPK